ncbi:DUF2243 domain-containing protein [Halorussus salilacus]|uniref:DUF2243 domain-containing protein n=1 Tax=Halorussus salilacus TaxID=2953750 RepID=UPI00209E70A8|nr:DUF2243 domain-containing protein [Halorussus salilacus]USZ67342.1 DUF2243 domain-containing protein [Halorussus salilacus]
MLGGLTDVSDRARPLVRAGIVLGVGFGGFFDGIVFHQLLQWHHMLSAHPDPAVASDLRLNVFWDGLFHAGTYLFTVGRVALVLRAWRAPGVPPSGRALLGATVAGWGVFNLVEGTVNHFLLGIHHVWPEGPGGVLLWDVLFLVWGAAFLVGGLAVVRGDPKMVSERDAGETTETG